MLGVGAVVVVSIVAFILGYTFAVNSILSSPNNNADATSSVLLRGEGKEELLLPVVAFTTSEDKTLLDNFCKFLHCILMMYISSHPI